MCTPQMPKPYAPPTSKPPRSQGTPVPTWMVRKVLEARHGWRAGASARQRAQKLAAQAQQGEQQSSLVGEMVGRQVLGGST